MPIKATCPDCGTNASFKDESVGKKAKCRKCGAVFALSHVAQSPKKKTPTTPDRSPKLKAAQTTADGEIDWESISKLERTGEIIPRPNKLTKLVEELCDIVLGKYTPLEFDYDFAESLLRRMAGKKRSTLILSKRLADALIYNQIILDVASTSSLLQDTAWSITPEEFDQFIGPDEIQSVADSARWMSYRDSTWESFCRKRAKELLKDLDVPTSPDTEVLKYLNDMREGRRRPEPSAAVLRKLGLNSSAQGAEGCLLSCILAISVSGFLVRFVFFP